MMDVESTSPSSDPISMDVDQDLPSGSSNGSIAGKPYTDDDHRRMDKEVAQALDPDVWHSNPLNAELHAVLGSVVAGDDRLDQKYLQFDNVRQLFREHPRLASAVADAWRIGLYRDIRELEILQDPVSVASAPLSKAQSKAFREGLSATYKGHAVDAFQQYLQKNDKAFHASAKLYYAKFCSIVQSSGTGKTRLMLQLATRGVCVLYMNIRSPNDEQGWPPRDDVPADLLHPSLTEERYQTRCYAFFSAVFKVLRMFLDKKLDWYKEMCEIESPTRVSFFKDLRTEFANIKKEVKSSPGEGVKVMNKYYQEMVTSKGFPLAQNQPRVVIALDEAHTLHEKRGPKFLPATVFLRTIKEYSELNTDAVWVVFASTTSKVSHFASPQDLYPSARVAVEGELLFPPFTFLGWNQNSPKLHEVQPDEVARAEHIIRYGRPLWVSVKENHAPETLLILAAQKLCGTKDFSLRDDHKALAVLAQRFGLDIAFGHRKAIHAVETLVASHLRVCLETTDDRIWSYTAYPPEPILSCAAAALLHEDSYLEITPSTNARDGLNVTSPAKDNLDDAFKRLGSMVNDGVVDIGQIGELVSRLLWLLAKDFFVRTKPDASQAIRHANSSFEKVLRDCQLIPVVQFLEFVFGTKIWAAAPEAKEVFHNAYVNFSHWVSMDSNIRRRNKDLPHVPIEEWTLRHWERTSAVQCCHDQPRIDKVIPMYFKREKKGDLAGMSQILISDKARTSSQQHTLPGIQRDNWSIAPGYRGLPYIAILVDLGLARSKFGATMDLGAEEPTRDPTADPTSVEEPMLDDMGDLDMESSTANAAVDSSERRDTCLRIYARGLDATTYPFLDDRAELTRILKDLYKRQTPPPSSGNLSRDLMDQARVGASSDPCHMDMKE